MLKETELVKKIDSSGKSKTYLAEKCGMSRAEFYNKLNNVREFKESEATILCNELNITTLKERKQIFLSNL